MNALGYSAAVVLCSVMALVACSAALEWVCVGIIRLLLAMYS